MSVLREDGFTALKYHVLAKTRRIHEQKQYEKWIGKHELTQEKKVDMLKRIDGFQNRPLISILLPVYDVDEKWLRICIESVLGQIYPHWELCIADDASKKPHIRPVIEEYAALDRRIKPIFRTENGHISAASNSALELATGEFTVLLDHDDELSPDALFWVANELNEFPDAKMIYSDEDLIDEKGRRSEPKFKPDFSRDLMYSLNLVTHLSAYNTELLKNIGGFRVGFEGSQDYDLALRVIEQISEEQIRHMPRILYHWRTVRTSVAYSSEAKLYAYEKARESLREHLVRLNVRANVSRASHNLNRVSYQLPDPLPSVSLIISSDEISVGMTKARIAESTDYPELEMITADQELSRAQRLNLAVELAAGDVLCFIDTGFLPESPDWLRELVGFAIQERIGVVGPKILKANRTILSAGLIVGTRTLLSGANSGLPRGHVGYFFRNALIGNFSAVSVSCMAIRYEVFETAGGFDEKNLPNKFFDADLCLRLGADGYRTVFTPYAEFIENSSEASAAKNKPAGEDEYKYFSKRWEKVIKNDPFYNPNLSKRDGRFWINI